MKKGILQLVILCSSLMIYAQDVHFSHYFSMPIHHNPAFTGYMNGDVRVAADFKMQWESFGEGFGNAYRTTGASVDFGFLRKQTGGSTLGVGATFINDQAGDLSLKTNQAGLALSYILATDRSGSNYIGLGFHGTYSQRSIDFTDANFPDVNESTNFIQSLNFFNLSAGLLWFFEPSDGVNFYIGGALHNIFEPNVTFVAGETINLDRRITAQFGSRFNVSQRVSFVPSVLFQKQGPSLELIFGTFFKYKFGSEYKDQSTSFQLGAFYRFGDAVVPVARIDYKPISFLFSYDVNVSKLTRASNGNGGGEVSIIYTGRIFPESNKNQQVKCPEL